VALDEAGELKVTRAGLVMIATAITVLGLAADHLYGEVIDHDRRTDLSRLLERQRLPSPRVLLLHPYEETLSLFPALNLAGERLLPISVHSRVVPLFPLRRVPHLYLLSPVMDERPHANVRHWRREVLDASRFFELSRLDLELSTLRQDFERIEVTRIAGGEHLPAPRQGGAFRLGDRGWQSVEVLEAFIEEERYLCLGVHPEPGYDIRISWPMPPATRRAQLHVAMRRTGNYDRSQRYTFGLSARGPDEAELRASQASFRASQLRDWRSLELDVSGARALELDLSAEQHGRHHLCLMGDLLR